MEDTKQSVPEELIENKIYLIRGEKVILDRDLAELYGIETRQLKRAVKKNMDRFPEDFMFVLTLSEYESLRCQCGTLARGGRFKYLPFAFTELGVSMLCSVLNSKRAIEVNIQIMRSFVQMRQMLATRADLAQKLEALEVKYDSQHRLLFKVIRALWLAVFKIRILPFKMQNRRNRFTVKKAALFMR